MKATEHEMTVAVDALARAAWNDWKPQRADSQTPFDDLPANVQMNLRQDMVKVAVAAIEAIPDRAAALRESLAILIDEECPHEDEHPEGCCEICDYASAVAGIVRADS